MKKYQKLHAFKNFDLKSARMNHTNFWKIVHATFQIGMSFPRDLSSAEELEIAKTRGMRAYSDAHARVKNWICDVQLPGKWYGFGFI